MGWNSQQYLKFIQQRTQPTKDLAARVQSDSIQTIVDLGCGPGNSTAVLRKSFPQAKILGIDSSENMIEKAKQSYPELFFELRDLNQLEGEYDLIYSNACLQWVANHEVLIPFLMRHLTENGVLAVQIPMNQHEPLYEIIHEVTHDPKWGFDSKLFEANIVLEPIQYFELLSSCSSSFDIWESVYYHAMPDHQSLLEWVKSTRLRPFLDGLNQEKALELENEILEKAIQVYPMTESKEIIHKS